MSYLESAICGIAAVLFTWLLGVDWPIWAFLILGVVSGILVSSVRRLLE